MTRTQLNDYIYKELLTKTEKDNIYELLCNIVEYSYMKSEHYSIENLAFALALMVVEEKQNVDNISRYDIYDKVDEL